MGAASPPASSLPLSAISRASWCIHVSRLRSLISMPEMHRLMRIYLTFTLVPLSEVIDLSFAALGLNGYSAVSICYLQPRLPQRPFPLVSAPSWSPGWTAEEGTPPGPRRPWGRSLHLCVHASWAIRLPESSAFVSAEASSLPTSLVLGRSHQHFASWV